MIVNKKQTRWNHGCREEGHRRSKREREMSLMIEAIRQELPQSSLNQEQNSLQILEFGAGSGFQIPFLQKLGRVTASDIVLDSALKAAAGINAVECGIAETPFDDHRFDLIFSNHVIEHLEDPQGAFRELRRIGKPDGVYAFSVPTNIWLMLSIPAQYWNRLRRLKPKFHEQGEKQPVAFFKGSPVDARHNRLNRFLPRGHGVEENFFRCYHQFKISTWRSFFERNQFTISAVKPLLLYGPSEFPMIPTLPAAGDLCSSVLFILRQLKQGEKL